MYEDIGQGEMYMYKDGKQIYMGKCINAEITFPVDEVANKRAENTVKAFNNMPKEITIQCYSH